MIRKFTVIAFLFLCQACCDDAYENFNRCAEIVAERVAKVAEYDLLVCGYQKIKKIKYFQSIKDIKSVSLDNNEISTLEDISKYKQIERLSLGNNKIRNIDGLEQLENLWGLSLSGNPIKSIEGLCKNKNKLTSLDISGNFYSLSEFNKCTKLTSLRITSSNISELIELPSIHKSLTQLQISYSPLNSIESIHNFTRLKNVSFSNTNIKTITPLKSLANVETLAVFNNKQLNDISAITHLKKLRFLNLKGSNNIPCEQIDLISTLNIEEVKLPIKCVK